MVYLAATHIHNTNNEHAIIEPTRRDLEDDIETIHLSSTEKPAELKSKSEAVMYARLSRQTKFPPRNANEDAKKPLIEKEVALEDAKSTNIDWWPSSKMSWSA